MDTATIYELSPASFAVAAPLFAGAGWDGAYVEMVLEGSQAGRVFVDDPLRPRGALLCRTYDYFLGGEPVAELRRFIVEAPAEAGVFADLYGYVPLNSEWETALLGYVPLNQAWDEAIRTDHQGRLEVIPRRGLRFDPAERGRVVGWQEGTPEGFGIRAIDRELAERIDREMDEHIGLFWDGYDRFVEGGFGFCAMAGDELASAAFAIAVSSREANIGVVTAERFRRRGLASLVCRACIEAGIERGVDPTWDCDAANRGSWLLALSLGFGEEVTFTELAFPGRARPALSRGSWASEQAEDGLVVWRRVSIG